MEEDTQKPNSRREYARQYYHKNRDRIRARAELRKENRKATQKRYYQRNKAACRERIEKYRVEHKVERNARERRERAEGGNFAKAEKARHIRRYSTNPRYRLRVLTTNAKNRSKHKGMAADADHLDQILTAPPSHCACCGCELNYCDRRRLDGPSIDRVRNDLGYVAGNVAVICFRCNTLKRNGSIEDFERILAYMRRFAPTLDT